MGGGIVGHYGIGVTLDMSVMRTVPLAEPTDTEWGRLILCLSRPTRGFENSAWASFEEDLKGTLTAGKLADVVAFDTNLVEAGRTNPAALLRARVLYTITGGRIVYQADPRISSAGTARRTATPDASARPSASVEAVFSIITASRKSGVHVRGSQRHRQPD